MTAACQSGDEKFINIKDYKYSQLDNHRVKMDLYGSTTAHYDSKCEVVFDLWNDWELESVLLTENS